MTKNPPKNKKRCISEGSGWFLGKSSVPRAERDKLTVNAALKIMTKNLTENLY